jgi:cysteinyl-tRNA synthetase
MYVCGITSYDFCHIGHARSALVFDMIVNYLRYSGYKVTYVRNFTDIDDKIINRANERNTTCAELAEKFIEEFYTDMNALGVGIPTIEPKATEHIQDIIDIIQVLENKGIAYQADGDVYFEVAKFKQYGALSGRNLEDLQAGARISVNGKKKNPMDFALWKGSKPGEPAWDSPWGSGRPGWHIECSAMSRKYLGDSFDIHGGGEDLVFPHHENEAAQSEAASAKPFVTTWIHHAFVTISDEKMSKSLNNFLTIREVLKDYHPEALRLTVFSTHYRHPLDYSEDSLREAMSGLTRLYNCMADCANLPAKHADGKVISSKKEAEMMRTLSERFCAAMDNDFNTAQALGILFEAIKILNRVRQTLPEKPSGADIDLLNNGAQTVTELANIMGLLRLAPDTFTQNVQDRHLAAVSMTIEEVDQLIKERLEARADKNWARADEIRKQLLEKRIELKDSPDGSTTWKVTM